MRLLHHIGNWLLLWLLILLLRRIIRLRWLLLLRRRLSLHIHHRLSRRHSHRRSHRLHSGTAIRGVHICPFCFGFNQSVILFRSILIHRSWILGKTHKQSNHARSKYHQHARAEDQANKESSHRQHDGDVRIILSSAIKGSAHKVSHRGGHHAANQCTAHNRHSRQVVINERQYTSRHEQVPRGFRRLYERSAVDRTLSICVLIEVSNESLHAVQQAQRNQSQTGSTISR